MADGPLREAFGTVLMTYDHSQGSAGKPTQYQSKIAALSDEVKYGDLLCAPTLAVALEARDQLCAIPCPFMKIPRCEYSTRENLNNGAL